MRIDSTRGFAGSVGPHGGCRQSCSVITFFLSVRWPRLSVSRWRCQRHLELRSYLAALPSSLAGLLVCLLLAKLSALGEVTRAARVIDRPTAKGQEKTSSVPRVPEVPTDWTDQRRLCGVSHIPGLILS